MVIVVLEVGKNHCWLQLWLKITPILNLVELKKSKFRIRGVVAPKIFGDGVDISFNLETPTSKKFLL